MEFRESSLVLLKELVEIKHSVGSLIEQKFTRSCSAGLEAIQERLPGVLLRAGAFY